MSNRVFWFLSFIAATLIAGAAVLLPSPQVDVPVQATPAGSMACTIDTGEESDPSPGQPLEWYQKNFTKPAGGAEACFAKGTPADVVAHLEQEVLNANSRYILNTRWSGAQGTPRALTWSFVPDGTNIPNGIGEAAGPSVLFATLDAQFAAQGGRATWIARVQACFDRWQAVSGLTYTRVTSGGNDWDDGAAMFGSVGAAGFRGDCRISMKNIDGVNNVLAYNFFPPSGGDMVLDASENWAAGAGVGMNRFMRNIISHEHGHGMGLSHVCPAIAAKLMEPFISTGYDGPRHDDLRAAQRHYGDVSGNNNTSATARVLGLLDVGSPITVGTVPAPIGGGAPTNSSTVSIDANGELDWYKFTLNAARDVTVTVTPRGQSYASYTQDANCNNNVANVNSLTIANLNVDLIDTNGVTVLATGAAQPSGGTETIVGFSLPAAGDYFVRVSEGDAPTESQLYTLDLSAAAPACTPVNVSPIAAASTVCGSAYASGIPTFTGTAPITWSLSGSPPAGMTINSGNGQVSWPIPVTSPTPYLIQVTGTNACGNDTEILSLSVLVGDFNGDGVLNDLDIPQFSDHLLGLDVSRICAADVNGDLAVDGLDLLAWVDLAQ